MDKRSILAFDGDDNEEFTCVEKLKCPGKRDAKSKKSGPFINRLTVLMILIWGVVILGVTAFAWGRLSIELLHKFTPAESFKLAFRNCYGKEGICQREERYMAPLGVYLMITGYVMLSFINFTLACFMVGNNDKPKLYRNLYCWLILDLIIVITAFVISIVGAIMVIFHHDKFDGETSKVIPQYQLYLWYICLMSSPILVLLFDIWIWKKVKTVYDSIDLSREVIKGVWSPVI